jgi:hypothetical protein
LIVPAIVKREHRTARMPALATVCLLLLTACSSSSSTTIGPLNSAAGTDTPQGQILNSALAPHTRGTLQQAMDTAR